MSKLALFGGTPAVQKEPSKVWPFYSSSVEKIILQKIRTGDVETTKIDNLVDEFETSFTRQYCEGAFGVFCNSGTSALLTAYFSLGLDYGAEVLVPSNTFRATVTPLLLLNLRPILCDSDRVVGSICLKDAESKITSKTQAIVVTHLWGHPVDMDKVRSLAHKYSLAIIEDCSHAHGAEWRNRPVGTFGDAAVFSMGTKKMISGGSGGMVITRNRDLYEKALLFSQPKHRAFKQMKNDILKSYLDSGLGANFRGTPFAAALALDHLKRLPNTVKIKNINIALLENGLKDCFPYFKPLKRSEHFTAGTWYNFYCFFEQKDINIKRLLSALVAEGIPLKQPNDFLHKSKIFHDQSLLTSYQFDDYKSPVIKDFKNNEYLAANLIGWETREFFEPAEEIISAYLRAFEKVNYYSNELV
ncbi:DegT/DnrJ/EryC1/StrS family aminotransferase [Paenibacillus sp. NPDC058177]|uniref:DegT/DnrJ/EryC1/StrS family aminotransferase n=1 Tax=Paenibacillus sp. NPDC058177 TaxID=3346369 RepID=UPI0036DAF39E